VSFESVSEPAITTRELRKSYGDVDALQGLSLEVEAGEFFGLLGPNGAGKTTFINILVGLARKSSGEVRVFGGDVEDDYREVRNRIGLAPQEFNVDRFFPIKEVLMHKAGYHGIPTEEAADRADEALRTVGIYGKRDTRFDWLSGGMKRRFMLARALVTDPDLLILDEPTAGVDVELRRDLWAIVSEMNDAGTTVLLTTHYIEEAERLCDRVAVMDQGQKVAVASPSELMERAVDTITVQLANPPGQIPNLGDAAIEDATIEGDRLAVTTHSAGQVAPGLLHQLEVDGFEITNLDISPASLEEVFVSLTNGQRSERVEDSANGATESGDADGEQNRALAQAAAGNGRGDS
jgi:ABC-2 type transport system ATP-binding protein